PRPRSSLDDAYSNQPPYVLVGITLQRSPHQGPGLEQVLAADLLLSFLRSPGRSLPAIPRQPGTALRPPGGGRSPSENVRSTTYRCISPAPSSATLARVRPYASSTPGTSAEPPRMSRGATYLLGWRAQGGPPVPRSA